MLERNFRRISFALLLILATSLQAEPTRIFLTWQSDPLTTMTIQWMDQDATAAAVDYRQEGHLEWRQARGIRTLLPQSTYSLYRVELTRLTPGTNYRFRIREDEEFRFRTLPAHIDDAPLVFVVGGDMLQEDAAAFAQTCQQAASRDPYFVLAGGDLAYAGRHARGKPQLEENWLSFFSIWNETMVTPGGNLIPLLSTIGNGDTNGFFDSEPADASWFYKLFPAWKDGYHVLDFADYLSLFVLDSGHTHPVTGPQTRWLKDQLAARSASLHRLAIYHVPAYPSFRRMTDPQCAAVRKHWPPVFDQFGLHAAFEHHDHTYKRTFPLKAGKPKSDGVVYLGDGCWGCRPRKVLPANAARWLAYSASKRHFIEVTLSKHERTYRAISGTTGEEFDSYAHSTGS